MSLDIDGHALRGIVELSKFIGLVMAPIVVGGAIAFLLEKPKNDKGKETGNAGESNE